MTQRVYQELPLTDYEGIVNANALRIDWNDVVPADEVDYILGNPHLSVMRVSRIPRKKTVPTYLGDRPDRWIM